jgi:hypothetical protein
LTAINDDAPSRRPVGAGRTRIDAGLASGTLFLPEKQLLFKGPGLGIAAPAASKRTSLEKYRRPYARTVVKAPSLDIEKHPLTPGYASEKHERFPLFKSSCAIRSRHSMYAG